MEASHCPLWTGIPAACFSQGELWQQYTDQRKEPVCEFWGHPYNSCSIRQLNLPESTYSWLTNCTHGFCKHLHTCILYVNIVNLNWLHHQGFQVQKYSLPQFCSLCIIHNRTQKRTKPTRLFVSPSAPCLQTLWKERLNINLKVHNKWTN